jgi:hypothetical protein
MTTVSRRWFAPILIAMLCVCLVGCTAGQILNDINKVVTDIEVVAPEIIALIPGPYGAIATQVVGWLADASAGMAAYSNCRDAVVATCVTKALANIVATAPGLNGLPVEIAQKVQAIVSIVESLLQNYGEKSSLVAQAVASGKTIHYSAVQYAQLGQLRQRALAQEVLLRAALAKK